MLKAAEKRDNVGNLPKIQGYNGEGVEGSGTEVGILPEAWYRTLSHHQADGQCKKGGTGPAEQFVDDG